MDGRVIDLPAPARFALVYGVIAPFRGPKSAAAYRKVWTAEGSPLLVHGQGLARGLGAALEWPVALGMRYGNPSIRAALDSLGAVDRLVVVPLYPQYASATTGSTLAHLTGLLADRAAIAAVSVVRPFVQYDVFLDLLAERVGEEVDPFAPDHVLFSYHGLPERHLTAASTETGGSACLARPDCCERPDARLGYCYRAHCLATSAGIAARTPLLSYSSAFQSRLGRDRWIQPATEAELVRLAGAGVRRLLVATPSFVADCLETVEEIGIRAVEVFRGAGGEELRLAPCLNADARWVEVLAGIVRGA